MIYKKWQLLILLIFLTNDMQNYAKAFNCLYEDTVNINDSYSIIENGSYVYNHHVIAPDLVDNYDYEILYDGSNRSVPIHKRACICQQQHCINLCSNNITKFYQEFIENDRTDLLDIFEINVFMENGNYSTMNITTDFEHIVFDKFCPMYYPVSPEIDADDKWTLLENGSLFRHKDRALLGKREYCFDIHFDKNDDIFYPLINPMNCPNNRNNLQILERINYWLQVVSIIFCCFTIFAHFRYKRFRNVSDKCFLTYLGSMTLSFAILSFVNLSTTIIIPKVCLSIGYINQFLQLSQYTWIAIISYDAWKGLRDMRMYDQSYWKYAMIGFSIPLLITLLVWCVQEVTKISNALKPGITANRCGLDVNKWMAVVYLYGYCFGVCVYCSVLFWSLKRNIEKSNNEKHLVHRRKTNNYLLYLRLFQMMGLCWILDVLSYVVHVANYPKVSTSIDYVNSLQGLYVFLSFIEERRRLENDSCIEL